MNYKISPEADYEAMQSFFIKGGTIENMSDEYKKLHIIWKRSDEILRKFPWYHNEKIANQLIADFPEYDIPLKTAKNHVSNAKKYYDFTVNETPATQVRLLTEICHKQIAILQAHQQTYKNKAHVTAKVIESWVHQIAVLNKLYADDVPVEKENSEINFILSSNDIDFDDVPSISEKEINKQLEKIAKAIDLTEAEKNQIYKKDVKNNIF